jgi:hypothetical protein
VRYPLNRALVVPRAGLECFAEEKNLSLVAGIEPHFLSHSACCLFTILTTPFQLARCWKRNIKLPGCRCCAKLCHTAVPSELTGTSQTSVESVF